VRTCTDRDQTRPLEAFPLSGRSREFPKVAIAVGASVQVPIHRHKPTIRPMRPEDVAFRFNDHINRRDLGGLAELMTDDHPFTDTIGATVVGKPECVEAWRAFFEQFSDYRNTFTASSARGDLAIAVGYSTCATEALNGRRSGQRRSAMAGSRIGASITTRPRSGLT
jgi:ketosteroid isomerase-like protein